MSCVIDYLDHYSYFDKKISAYNYLQYSDATWALFNPALHYQNRLRHRDYLDLFYAAGFEVVEEERYGGTEREFRGHRTTFARDSGSVHIAVKIWRSAAR